MSRLIYAIRKTETFWRIVAGTREIGWFTTFEQAVTAALALAAEARDCGHAARVVTPPPPVEDVAPVAPCPHLSPGILDEAEGRYPV